MASVQEEFYKLRRILPDYKAGDTPFNELRFKSSDFSSVELKGEKKGSEKAVAGIFSVFGNRDAYGDRMQNGSMSRSMKSGRRRIRHLWNHIGWDPPIAAIEDIFEIEKNDLPDIVLERAPDATGAAVVVRSYLDTPRAVEIRAGINAGAINEMSFAFDIVKADPFEEYKDGERIITRLIKEVVLFDTSDVNWGANDATLAQKTGGGLDVLLFYLKNFLIEYKAGMRTTATDHAMYADLAKLMAIDTPAKPPEPVPAKDSPAEVSSGDLFRADLLLNRLTEIRLEC